MSGNEVLIVPNMKKYTCTHTFRRLLTATASSTFLFRTFCCFVWRCCIRAISFWRRLSWTRSFISSLSLSCFHKRKCSFSDRIWRMSLTFVCFMPWKYKIIIWSCYCKFFSSSANQKWHCNKPSEVFLF